MDDGLTLRAYSRLWTFMALHEEEQADNDRWRAPRSDTIEALQNLAEAVLDRLGQLDHREVKVSALFQEAVRLLSGSRLTDLRKRQLGLRDKEKFDDRVSTLRRAYGLEDLDYHHEHRPGRALILHAGEFVFVPYAEGALAAIQWWPGSSRWDVRSAFHTAVRWAYESETALPWLVAEALSPSGSSRPWRPLTRFYEAVLQLDRKSVGRLNSVAEQLSRATVDSLRTAHDTKASHGKVIRRLMNSAEDLGVLSPRPRFERDEAGRRATELARLVLDVELEREVVTQSLPLIELLRVSDKS